MAHLYLTEQGAYLGKSGDRLIVSKGGEVLLKVPRHEIEAVLIFGNVQFSTQAVNELLEHGIELALLSRNGRLRGQLTPPKAKNVPLRMEQYRRVQDESFCLHIAREIVGAKIDNQVTLLQRYRSNHPGRIPGYLVEDLANLRDASSEAGSLDSLRGVEGAAARRYFELLAECLPPELGFSGRNRRPPRDPVNALLSFGYLLVGNEIQSLLDAIGFDPYLGFFHQLDYGRPSLALDLLEEVRAALVDRFTLRLLGRRTLAAHDFSDHPSRGTRLTRDGLKLFFERYEQFLTTPWELGEGEMTFRNLFRRQAERLARALEEGERYEAFRWAAEDVWED